MVEGETLCQTEANAKDDKRMKFAGSGMPTGEACVSIGDLDFDSVRYLDPYN